MENEPTLYDLFGDTSLLNCKRLLDEGEIPGPEQLADILEANADQPLPAWFIELLAKRLRGQLKAKPGRPKQTPISLMRFAAATHDYHTLCAWLIKRQQTSGLEGWPAVKGKDWWSGPPHERAARISIAKWRLHIS